MELTIQTLLDGTWHDAATLEFPQPEQGVEGPCFVEYTFPYLEAGGDVDWPGLLASFGPDEDFLRNGLRELASRLRDLPERLERLGLPPGILNAPPLGLADTEAKLRRWTLL